MKKAPTISILLLSLVFIAPMQVSAVTNAGVKPGSLLYFFDTAFENMGLFFTFDPEKKVQKTLEHADERLAEAEESANENDPKAVEKAMIGYEEDISLATEKSKELKDEKKAEELLNIVSENTAKHQEVLRGVLEKVPEEAKEAILKAIEVSKRGQEEAAKQIAELKGEIEKLKKEVEELKKETSDQQADEVEKLKKEVEALKKQNTTQSTPKQPTATTQNSQVEKEIEEKPKTITLPNGAIVEMDASGNIVRTIKEAPQQVYTAPAPTTQTQTSTTIQISSVNVTPTVTSARIEWQTDKPTESKVFISGGGLSSKVYNSESGLSTRHTVFISGLRGATKYSYEIEAIAGGNAYKKTGNFLTQSPPPPEFSIEKFWHSTPPSSEIFFLRTNQKNGNFLFKALVFELSNPNDPYPFDPSSSKLQGLLTQTNNLRGLDLRYCTDYSINLKEYNYPCPTSGDPEKDNPVYLISTSPRSNGDTKPIPIDPNIPYPDGISIYYYKVVDTITGKVFEYQK